MKKVNDMITTGSQSIIDLRKEMTRIRRLGEKITTNYFNQCNKCIDLLCCWIGEKSCVFSWEDVGINRIYFYSADINELGEILKMMPADYCIDYITREKEEYKELFLSSGFELRFEYGRFVNGKNEEHPEESAQEAKEMEEVFRNDTKIQQQLYNAGYGEPAKVEDAEEIDGCLREKFDPFESHFYDMETLREHIRKGWVWVARKDGKIVAAQLVEIQGRKYYGAFMFNNGPVEALTSLLAAMGKEMGKKGCTQNYCWMNLANKRALRYNIKYNGLVFDNMYDMIYVKKPDTGEEKT